MQPAFRDVNCEAPCARAPHTRGFESHSSSRGSVRVLFFYQSMAAASQSRAARRADSGLTNAEKNDDHKNMIVTMHCVVASCR